MANQAKTILLVDDELLNLDMLSRRLERSGFQVDTAPHGEAALEALQHKEYDLVLLDYMMPGMSGPEVLYEIRQHWNPVDLPVIMVTAVAESSKIAEVLGSGANDYVTKPLDFQVALARIQVQLDRRRAELALRISEERYALASEAARDALWDWNLAADSLFLSPRWMGMIGLPAQATQTTPETWLSRVFATDLAQVQSAIAAVREGSAESLYCEYRLLDTKNVLRWMSSRAIVTRDDAGTAVRLSGSQSDITEERTNDVLTGLLNRLAIVSRLEQLFQQAKEGASYSSANYAVLFLDLDGFKIVNDSLGHLAGDELLCLIADRLRAAVAEKLESSACANQYSIARMGGDEFAVLVEAPQAFAEASTLADSVQQRMLPPTHLGDRQVHCAFSIGVAGGCKEHEAADSIINDADVAMYTAKAAGRGRVMAFTPEMRRAALDRLELENDLRCAVDRGELRVLYQPKVRLDTGAIYGVEALVRWEHPERGTIAPAVFIPIAEKIEAILGIGEFVLRTACAQVRRWQLAYPGFSALELSVNLSPKEFRKEGLASRTEAILQLTGYPAHLLHLEVTEGVLFEDLEGARQVLHQLHRLGVLLDLDDFGSGYSSLRYLRELPFDTLKIDRYFISALDSGSASSAELIHTILNMARALELDVVAEGIETHPHRTALQQMGCRYGQGYYFSKPIQVEQMEVLLTAQSEREAATLRPVTDNAHGLGCFAFGMVEAIS